MLKHAKTYLDYGNRFCGIEHASQKGQEIYFSTLLKKKTHILDIEVCHKESSLEKLKVKLPKKQHICLIINNNNVLAKQIESDETNILKAVYNAFPSINLDDFYYEVIVQKNNQFVSICRKAYVEELVNNYIKEGFSVINITLGNSIISGISTLLDSKNITTSNANVFLEDNTISKIEKTEINNEANYNVNGIEISNNHLLSCSGALSFFINSYNPNTNFEELKSTFKKNYKQSRFYTVFLKSGLVMLLLILLINFFVFNNYFNKVKTLQQTSQLNQTTKQNILKLNENVSKSQRIVEDMLKSNSSKSSFYINAIIQNLPNSILLSDLNYQPLIKRIKADKRIQTEINSILISGKSNNSEIFSNWLSDLENTNWIHKIEIINYEDFSKTSSKFSLKLDITDDK